MKSIPPKYINKWNTFNSAHTIILKEKQLNEWVYFYYEKKNKRKTFFYRWLNTFWYIWWVAQNQIVVLGQTFGFVYNCHFGFVCNGHFFFWYAIVIWVMQGHFGFVCEDHFRLVCNGHFGLVFKYLFWRFFCDVLLVLYAMVILVWKCNSHFDFCEVTLPTLWLFAGRSQFCFLDWGMFCAFGLQWPLIVFQLNLP